MSLEDLINEVLVETFNTISDAEENAIKSHNGADISISEMHLIEAVGKGENEKTVSSVAQDLNITLPSVTIAIQKLEKKGYIIKKKSDKDARSVIIELTDLGVSINNFHKRFHTHMVKSVIKQLSEEEQEVLYRAISKLNAYFKKAIQLAKN